MKSLNLDVDAQPIKFKNDDSVNSTSLVLKSQIIYRA